jgi:hypothetical protein
VVINTREHQFEHVNKKPSFSEKTALHGCPPTPERFGSDLGGVLKMKDTEYLQPRLVSIAKAGQLLGIGRTKTYDLMSERVLETIAIGGRRLVTLRSIDRLIENATMEGAA